MYNELSIGRNEFREPPAGFRPMMFWHWNGPISRQLIEEHIAEFVDKRVGGVVLFPLSESFREDILATVYRKQDKALIALASWSEAAVEVNLDIDWQALGLDPATATLTAPPIANFQDAAEFAPDQPIPVESAKGWLLVVED